MENYWIIFIVYSCSYWIILRRKKTQHNSWEIRTCNVTLEGVHLLTKVNSSLRTEVLNNSVMCFIPQLGKKKHSWVKMIIYLCIFISWIIGVCCLLLFISVVIKCHHFSHGIAKGFPLVCMSWYKILLELLFVPHCNCSIMLIWKNHVWTLVWYSIALMTEFKWNLISKFYMIFHLSLFIHIILDKLVL